jgi:hypothetical protein
VNLGYSGDIPPSYAHISHLDSIYAFSYRNDAPNKKVYILLKDSTSEKLWYDFNMNVGDSLNPNSYVRLTSSFGPNAKVTSIDSVDMCGSYHKRFNFNCTFSESIVEGVGFTSNFFRTHLLVCAFEPLELDNTTSASTDYCPDQPTQVSIALSVGKDVFPENVKLKLQPNPVNTQLTINMQGEPVQVFSYSVIDCLGKTIVKGLLNTLSVIDVSGFEKGLYFIQVTDKNGRSYQSKFVKN